MGNAKWEMKNEKSGILKSGMKNLGKNNEMIGWSQWAMNRPPPPIHCVHCRYKSKF